MIRLIAAEELDIPPFDFISFMGEHWLKFILIFAFLVYIYNKVFRTRKLPMIKDAIIYGTIAIGAFVLLIFQVDAGLPILLSLSIAVGLMLIVRIRYFLADRKKARSGSDSHSDSV